MMFRVVMVLAMATIARVQAQSPNFAAVEAAIARGVADRAFPGASAALVSRTGICVFAMHEILLIVV